MNQSKDETVFCGPGEGKYLQFNFYIEKPGQSPITKEEASNLQHRLVGWFREQEFGFDGSSYLGNVFKDMQLQKVEAIGWTIAKS